MDLVSFLRRGSVAASLAIATAGFLAACSTPQPQAQSTGCYSGAEDTAAKQAAGCESYAGPIGSAGQVAAPQTSGVYSGKEDAAAKQAAGGCQPPEGQAQAKSPEELSQALQNSPPSPYGRENAAARNAAMTCQ